MTGEPNFLLMTTLRPRGPNVTFTASASTFTPRRIAWRDSSPCTIIFGIVAISYQFSCKCVPRFAAMHFKTCEQAAGNWQLAKSKFRLIAIYYLLIAALPSCGAGLLGLFRALG